MVISLAWSGVHLYSLPHPSPPQNDLLRSGDKFLLSGLSLHHGIPHFVAHALGAGDEHGLAVGRASGVAEHVEVLGEEEEVHDILGGGALDAGGEVEDGAAEAVDDRAALDERGEY